MLPGGGREEDEHETTCVAREVLEECGVIVHVDCLLSDVAADPPDGTYVRWRTYRCTVVSGEPKAGGGEGPSAELIAIRWLPLESAVWSDDITTDRFLYPQLLALRASPSSPFNMDSDALLEDFNCRRRGAELPFVLDDEVEVLEGIYCGKRGTVDLLAYAETPLRYLVDFRDGTDELFAASALKLVRAGAA